MIHQAIIPIAGLGSRIAPLSAAVPKALLPLPDPHFILSEAATAGVSEALLVVSPQHAEPLRRYEAAARAAGDDLPAVRYIVQESPAGFGDAVLLAHSALDGGPVLVMLGDHVHVAEPSQPTCAAQVAAAMATFGGQAMVGVQPVGEDELCRVGVAAGEPVGGAVLRCTAFAEKPSVEAARLRLRIAGLPAGQYLAHAGIYAFGPEIFDHLQRLAAERRQGELQLADAQAALLAARPDGYFLCRIAGRALDTGTPDNYIAAWRAMLAAQADSLEKL
jgi:UTP--glucose-1-phosphate uridylyltransferase